jgi:23S rRNA (guanosine2251-2'-O)-methyltransferase
MQNINDRPLRNEIIEGRNAVTEALRSNRPIDKLYVAKEGDSALRHLASVAHSKGIAVSQCDRRKLDYMSVTGAHQGVIALCAVQSYCSLADILQFAESSGESPFLVICDEISDPHNMGAVIRTAECVGAHGVILPKHRSAGLTTIVDKASAGAAEYMRIARVTNLSACIRELKEHGIWVYGTASNGDAEFWTTDLTGPVALVVGSEGRGISRLVRESCDRILSIPMKGKLDSLNASVAAGVVMYEILRQRTHFHA